MGGWSLRTGPPPTVASRSAQRPSRALRVGIRVGELRPSHTPVKLLDSAGPGHTAVRGPQSPRLAARAPPALGWHWPSESVGPPETPSCARRHRPGPGPPATRVHSESVVRNRLAGLVMSSRESGPSGASHSSSPSARLARALRASGPPRRATDSSMELIRSSLGETRQCGRKMNYRRPDFTHCLIFARSFYRFAYRFCVLEIERIAFYPFYRA